MNRNPLFGPPKWRKFYDTPHGGGWGGPPGGSQKLVTHLPHMPLSSLSFVLSFELHHALCTEEGAGMTKGVVVARNYSHSTFTVLAFSCTCGDCTCTTSIFLRNRFRLLDGGGSAATLKIVFSVIWYCMSL